MGAETDGELSTLAPPPAPSPLLFQGANAEEENPVRVCAAAAAADPYMRGAERAPTVSPREMVPTPLRSAQSEAPQPVDSEDWEAFQPAAVTATDTVPTPVHAEARGLFDVTKLPIPPAQESGWYCCYGKTGTADSQKTHLKRFRLCAHTDGCVGAILTIE